MVSRIQLVISWVYLQISEIFNDEEMTVRWGRVQYRLDGLGRTCFKA